ncbi:MAG: hypothetical protein ACRC33_17325, partial [Gemmataceae bacterium]
MGVYDDAARFAAEADPPGFLSRLLAPAGRADLTFRGWLNPRTSPLPGGPERTADLLAVPAGPWLLAVELQSRPDDHELAVTLETAGIFTSRAVPAGGGRYRVTGALVHLTGRPPEAEIDARLGPFGTYHRPLPGDVQEDDGGAAIDGVVAGRSPWSLLFWVAFMRGAEEETIISRWMDAVAAQVADARVRSDLVGVSLIFAELNGRFLAWERMLRGWTMTESAVVNSWILQGRTRGVLESKRQFILETLDIRFPGAATADVRRVIEQQDAQGLLDDWFRAALRAEHYDDFLRRF